MVEYFTNPDVPTKTFFACSRMRATLSTVSCSAMWRRADALDDGANNACRLCPVGAVHAGEAAASMSPLKGTLTCARCHRTAGRLIGAMVCVSCYNRAREVLIGRNAKGTAPVKLCALDTRRLRYRHGDDVRTLRVRYSVDIDELMVAVLRDSKSRVVFAFNSTPPAAAGGRASGPTVVARSEPAQGWSITDHCCRVCFGRVLMRETFERKRVYRCSCCDLEAEGRTEAAICTCGIRLKTGVDAGIRCQVADNPTPEFPARITACQVAPPASI